MQSTKSSRRPHRPGASNHTHHLQALLDSGTQGSLLLDEFGNILALNQRAKSMFRIWNNNREPNVGDHILICKIPLDKREFDTLIQQAMGGTPIERVLSIPSPTGDPISCEMQLFPVHDQANNTMGTALHLRDITERKAAEEALVKSQQEAQKLALIANKTDNAILLMDPELRIEWVNDGFVRSTGYSLEDCLGKRSDDLLSGPDTDPDTLKFIRASLQLKDGFEVQVQYYTKAGENMWIDLEVQPIFDSEGELVQYFSIHRDITHRKAYEEELQEAKRSAELATAAKSEFLSNMSHEIRTPLNAIIGLTDLLLNQSTQPENTENLEAIQYSSRNLLVVINDILDLSKIEAGKLVVDQVSFNVRQLIKDAIRTMAPRAREKGLILREQIDSAVPPFIFGDPVRLNQILLNLVSNAIKFTEQGDIRVECTVLPRPDQLDLIEFQVVDTGIGIPTDKLDFIFESFTQSDSNLKRKHGGTGLGLAISRKLVEMMGGTIQVHSTPDRGSQFIFQLPFEPVKAVKTTRSSATGTARELPGMQILVVEDNQINQLVIEQVLRSWKAEVKKANNGSEALKLLENNTFDLILMDIQMPVMDGLEATKNIRELEQKTKTYVPIIAVSADVFRETQEKAKLAGMDGFVTKPIEQDKLFDLIATLTAADDDQPAVAEINTNTMLSNSVTEGRINLDYLRENISDEDEFLAELLVLFRDSNSEDLNMLKTLGQSLDYPELKKIAHKLKSSFKSLGLTHSVDLLISIENAALEEADQARVQDLVEQVHVEFGLIVEEIDRMLG